MRTRARRNAAFGPPKAGRANARSAGPPEDAGLRTADTRKQAPVRRRRGRARLLAVPLAAAALLALGFVAFRGQPRQEPPPSAPVAALPPPRPSEEARTPKPDFAAAQARERAAEAALREATGQATRGEWAAARNLLDQIQREYADTAFWTNNPALFEGLRDRIARRSPPPGTPRPPSRPGAGAPAPERQSAPGGPLSRLVQTDTTFAGVPHPLCCRSRDARPGECA